MPHPPIRGPALVLLTITLSLATFMNVLDTSIANVAIPTLSGDLAVSPSQGTWVITSFAVSTAIVLPLTGWLAARIGEVRLFVSATLLFSLASWLCGLAVNLPMLVVFRVIQGAVAGPMIPLSQSLLLANYPPEKRGLALAFWSMTTVIAPIFGPILGGWITDNVSWPWIFYINIPVGALSALATLQLLRGRETATRRRPIDTVGLALLVVGVACLQILLDKGNELDWFGSPTIVALAATAVVSLSFFVVWELTDDHPVVDLSLFRSRNFAVGTLAFTLGYLVFFGNVVIYPLWLQTRMGYTATWAGLAAAPIGVLAVVLSPVVGHNMHKWDLRPLVSVSFVVFAVVAFWTAGFNTQVDFWQLVAPRFLQGAAMACFFVPLISILLSGLPPQRLASASGIANFFRVLGGSFGTSLSVTLWDRRAAFHHAQLTENLSAVDPASQRALEHLHALGLQGKSALAALNHVVTNQAYMLSSNDFFWLSGWIFVAMLVPVWLARPPFIAGGGGGGGGGGH